MKAEFILVPPHFSFPIPAPFFHSRAGGNLPTPSPTAQINFLQGVETLGEIV